MIYAESFKDTYPHIMELLTLCGNLHSDPMAYADMSGNLVGCNEHLAELLGVDDFADIPPLGEWFEPVRADFSLLFSQPGSYRGKIFAGGAEYTVAVKSEVVLIEDAPLVGIVFRDTTLLERAKAAERYFEDFKKKFLTSISHEFRTPMNAVIGFGDLLKSTPLSSWQQEYIQMSSQSALSMMRNIENLLELMQVESGSVHSAPAFFNPIEVFESFSMQFTDLALSKDIQLMFLIDPHLPKSMIGDQDKILVVMRNLIQNGIKYTAEGGRVLVEILIVKEEGRSIEVEYAISDTGIGIEKEKIKTLLRPFASAWENQRQGKSGLGIGLSLSRKYVEMMDSHLMFASEPGKGSRFSFRIVHQAEEGEMFDFVEGTRAAIYTEEHHFTAQGALLYKYLELFNVQIKGIYDLVNGSLYESDVLFLDISHISKSQVAAIKSTYPDLQVVPIMRADYGEKADAIIDSVESIVTLPILPSSLYKTLSVVWNTMPKEHIRRKYKARSEPHRILVAEDNLINLKLLETVLLQEHFQVVAVDNGQKAVDAYLKQPFDLVLMDIDMPVMDGLTANRLIKEIDKRDSRGYVPVIALTAHALAGDRERIVSAGLDAHLAKPIDKYFLFQTIERYLKIAQQKRQNTIV